MLTRTIGTSVQVRGVFKDLAGGPLEPDVIQVTIKRPDETSTTYTYGVGATVVQEADHIYYAWVLGDQAGDWFYQFKGTSGTEYVISEGAFRIVESLLS